MSSLFEVRTPLDQSEGTRSQVLRWLRAVGERVAVNEPLVELETDKVTIEIPAPAGGILREILKGAGEEVAPGDLLGQIEAAAPAETSTAASSARAAEPGPAVAGVPTRGAAGRSVRDRLSPAVRRLMAEHALDVNEVDGSGEGGRITAEDVLKVAQARAATASAAAAASPAPDAPPVARRVPHSLMRKRIAEHMVQSLLHTAPHVTSVFEADMSAVTAHRRKNHADFEQRGAALTLTTYFVAAAVDAIRAVPESNSRWSEDALEIYDTINIGVAAALEGGGLLVPVLRAVESRHLFDIARGLNDLVTRARARELTPADLRGGTFTLSNHGTSGSLLAAPIVINQAQSAILGIGKLEKRAAVIDDAGVERIVVRPRCYVTLTIDHRVLDGHDANRFLQAFVARLESWPL
jgi:2-oxoglutarate dehydrogenase E2 component (dihydrolipoamide succinyltransferase)